MRFGCWFSVRAMCVVMSTWLTFQSTAAFGDEAVKATGRSSPAVLRLRVASAPTQAQETLVSDGASSAGVAELPAAVTTAPPMISAPPVVVDTNKNVEFKHSSSKSARDLTGLRPAIFKNVTVGSTTAAELTRRWGKETSQESVEGALSLSYQMPPFASVEATIVEGVVAAILIELNSPKLLANASEELRLTSFVPVMIPDQFGQRLGVVYPERGVMFGFAPASDNADDKDYVQQILIEPIAAEPFVLRTLYSNGQSLENSLSDLRLALTLDSKNGQAFQLRASILRETGQYTRALKDIAEAESYAPNDMSVQLLHARLLGDTGKTVEAKQIIDAVLSHTDTTDDVKARAELQLGSILAAGSKSDHVGAVEHCQTAIRLAIPLATDPRTDIRREAKNILLEAHLAVASNIAHGSWQKKQNALPKWLEQGAALAEDFILNEQGHEALRFLVHRRALDAYAGLEQGPDPSKATDAVIKAGRDLIGKSDSELFKHQVGWELGQALIDSVAIERSRGRSREALKYSDIAATLLEGSAKTRELTNLDRHRLASLYFFAGSVHAVQLANHQDAVSWYDKSRQQLSKQENGLSGRENEIGEWLVSMGVTYWEAGQRDEGMKLTTEGLQMMKRAVGSKKLDNARLTVPYGNLAAMHLQLGDKVKAGSYERLAKQLTAPERKRR